MWNIYTTTTWNDLVLILGGTGATWEAAGTSRWSDYTSANDFLMYAGTDGEVYTHSGESLNGDDINEYRIEPILDFGNKRRFDHLQEIWFDIGRSADFSIDLYHRDGNTVGEILNKSWDSLGSISCDSLYAAIQDVNKNARLHQIKWGTDLKNEAFQINGIVFKYVPGSER
jgi:hypothetical protein